jgi:hypothetical protein
LQIKKKTAAVVAAAAIGSVAVGGAAWAYIVSTGTGSASATTTATAGTVALTGDATIADLDTPAAVVVNGTASANNRRINNVTISINSAASLPSGCLPAWFELRVGTSGAFSSTVTAPANHTFATAGTEDEDIVPNVFVQLKNVDADQSSCVSGAPLTSLLSLTTTTS